jgi:hypothetical protein
MGAMGLHRDSDSGYDIAVGRSGRTKMHQTTVRFGSELWEQLEVEAARSGVSVAHYVRDAALARIAYTAGARARSEPDNAFAWAGEDMREALAHRVEEQAEDTHAVQAQAYQARRQAQALRDEAAAARQRRH